MFDDISDDISIHALLAESDTICFGLVLFIDISIHALLAESDISGNYSVLIVSVISIHALLAESDLCFVETLQSDKKFLSTLSLRRATKESPEGKTSVQNFYPRSPCGERQPLSCATGSMERISIHALLAESDVEPCTMTVIVTKFLSTLSLRRATTAVSLICCRALYFYPRSPCGERPCMRRKRFCLIRISIHALLAESDQFPWLSGIHCQHFYPRSPCGERQRKSCSILLTVRFLSTLSLRRATRIPECVNRKYGNFYPRSPCGERQLFRLLPLPQANFYPRSPCGERPLSKFRLGANHTISIHALLAESDDLFHGYMAVHCISIHALLAESDLKIP